MIINQSHDDDHPDNPSAPVRPLDQLAIDVLCEKLGRVGVELADATPGNFLLGLNKALNAKLGIDDPSDDEGEGEAHAGADEQALRNLADEPKDVKEAEPAFAAMSLGEQSRRLHRHFEKQEAAAHEREDAEAERTVNEMFKRPQAAI